MLTLPKQRIFEVLQSEHFIATFTGRSRRDRDSAKPITKIIIKTILLNERPHFQLNTYTEKQHFAKNVEATKPLLDELLDAALAENFMQVHIQTPIADTYVRVLSTSVKANTTAPSKSNWDAVVKHNNEKQYLISPDNARILLWQLGICNEKGVLVHAMSAKYKQINHFLSIATKLDVFEQDTIRIIDCGCGKAYLSLALFHYLTVIKNKSVELLGVDSNKDVITFCSLLSQKLGYANATFVCSEINTVKVDGDIDVLIALHACDTATDDALNVGIKHNAKAILAAPCCHHYINEKLKATSAPPVIAPLLRDGIARERFADLLTDSMRRDILRAYGYSAELIEFVAPEHTMKNIMIRAEKVANITEVNQDILQTVRAEREQWKAAPKLAEHVGV